MDGQTLIVVALAAASVGGVAYVFLYPYLSGEIHAQKRTAALMSTGERVAGGRASDPAKRRKLIQESLGDVETKRAKRATLEQRIARAGLTMTPSLFVALCGVFAICAAGAVFVFDPDILVVVGVAVVAGLGAPHWLLGFLARRRIAKFVDEFPNAVDIIIRGVKAGLPVADCFRIIAGESPEPIRGEFRRIVESQAIGLSIGEATERFAERVPVAEASFFSIVVNLQQRSGGNLSEALGNLAGVLRERKKMKAKVKAMSAEAKASAGIIGSLPFLVGLVVWFSNPAYIGVLFKTTIGNFIIGASLLWMLIGIVVMKQMIDFEI